MAHLIGVRFIPDVKLIHYLLDIEHMGGGPKARFLIAHGFSRDDPNALAIALLVHADMHPIRSELAQPRGINRLVRGGLRTPDGRNPIVDVVWVQDTGSTLQRLVTAYPA